ncbi:MULTISPECIES: hypothetical protein [unclassified Xanthomonas]|uniref:hypothetical protein n=1 Tax=unclassified Xanthomonas TaxID=2643310 RepID=UPI002A829265|nr:MULTISPECIES: hypothetical protein [unclassified Xanthomonas]MDY4297353.1 hypothetical protein [Xanthomonas sp. LF02-5]MDY4359147.1 hypothetical protein [Xanthomonas sp. LF04-12]
MTSTSSSVVEKFFELALEAERIDSECMEEPLEPAFDAVLSFVIAHPECRDEFAGAFMRLARDPSLGPPELIQYCMHALRWDDIKISLSSWLQSEKSERVRHVLRKIIMSFDDDWYDADLYARFQRDQPRADVD